MLKATPNNINTENEYRDPMMPNVSVDSTQNNQYGTHYPH